MNARDELQGKLSKDEAMGRSTGPESTENYIATLHQQYEIALDMAFDTALIRAQALIMRAYFLPLAQREDLCGQLALIKR